MDPTKLAIGAGTAVLIAGGGYGVSTLFSQEPIYLKTATVGTFGEDFQLHFADASGNENDSWWSSRFSEKYKSETAQSNDFKNLSGFDKLKEKCNEAYKKATKTDISPDEDSDQSKAKYESDIWIFCSIDGVKPLTIGESVNEEPDFKDGGQHVSKLGGTKKKKLISTKNSSNQKFWDRQAKAFFLPKENKDSLGKRASDAGAGFKTLYDDQNKRATKDLKDACETRYKDTSDSGNKDNETLKFCSLQGYKGS
ncbi:hypothetical protein [Candidatus Mycoplasma haematohominis]|uniref:Uncharacterized protein n=1 Tax=Candidatus Mycoplasma haematohominis TaxID=1494318 RepID=A0A478FUT4_9MOLU|nr:hypothetical protein [Candidatus Mycoplasma haemohominis]GCE63810.1 hypothetical protein MHSWG343_08170 [Candidatus Mycoplasma haemohominis]